MAIQLQGYTADRAEYLTNNCKWSNRYFKPLKDLKVVSEGTDLAQGWHDKIRGRFPAHMMNLNDDIPTLFAGAFSEHWYSADKINNRYTNGLAFLMQSYGEPEDCYGDLINAFFHESMFMPADYSPVQQDSFLEDIDYMSNELGRGEPAYRPNRPELSNFQAMSYRNDTHWRNRTFKGEAFLLSVGAEFVIPTNLWDYIISTKTNDDCNTLGKILDHILKRSTITWNGIINDLSYDEGLERHSIETFNSKFKEVWFYAGEPGKRPLTSDQCFPPTKVQSKLIDAKSVDILSTSPKIKLINKNNEPQTLKIKSNVKIRN